MARMERAGKKKIKEAKLEFKTALKEQLPDRKILHKTSVQPEEIEHLKGLSKELKKAVADFKKLDDSEIPAGGADKPFAGWLVVWPDSSKRLPVPGRSN